jgi:hypothetical protein
MFGKTGSILLSIGNLPPQVSLKALKAHIQGVIDGLGDSGFRLTPSICSCNILRLTNPVTGVVTHQGLVSIQPPKLAFQVMNALERKPLRGLNLQVSRYRHGSFPVSSSMPLTSMSDLLGLSARQDDADAVPLQIDLVSDTGVRKPVSTASPKAERSRSFAH